jgi:hypothetical protein
MAPAPHCNERNFRYQIKERFGLTMPAECNNRYDPMRPSGDLVFEALGEQRVQFSLGDNQFLQRATQVT